MMLAILLTLVGSIFADNLTVSSVELNAGETKDVTINLNSSEKKYVAFQFDIVLPEGVTVELKSNGKPKISLNEDRIDDHTLTVQDLGSGSYRLLCFSMTNAEFYGTSGALVKMTLQADENASAGTKEGIIKSQVFTETDGHQVKWDDVSFNISIASSSGSSTEASSLTVSEIELKKGNTQEAAINLNNGSKKYVAFQFDVVLPEGVSIAKKENGKLKISLNADRIDDHTLTVQDLGSGSYRLLCFSMTNAEFYGTSGALVNMTLQADESASAGTKEGVIKSQVFTETDGHQVKWDDVSFNISIAAAVIPEITADNKTRKYGEDNPELTYTTTATLTGVPQLTTTATKTSPVGEYEIVVERGTVQGDYTSKNGKLTITKAPLTITAKSYTIKQGDALPTFEAEYAGFKNNETDAVLTTKPTITTTATSASEPGTYEIVVSGAEATNYDITYVKGTLTITKADEVVVTAKSYSRKYGEANPTFEYTTSGATLSGTPSISCEATATSPVGEYDIVVSKGSITNYNLTLVNGKLTVTKAPLTITAKSYTIKQGDALPTFEAEYAGFKNNETDAVLTTKPTITTTATSASEPGTYEIVVSGAEATNYDISYVKGTLTISAVEVKPINETETTTFSESVNENTDLSNTIIDNTYYTMSEENGDGYDATEQAIVLNSTTSKEQMNTVQDAQVGDATMQENFNGIIFEVPAGNGNITVEAKTIGSHILNVQIGNDEPTKITKSERGTEEVPYDVKESTYVYLYASTSGASGAPQRAAAANSVLLYSYKVDVLVNGIHLVTYSNQENAKWYTMDGLQLQGKPTKKGLYIVNGRKVIVK